MIPALRLAYNASFTPVAYQQLLADLNKGLSRPIEFRVAETPVFLEPEFKTKLLMAGQEIISFIHRNDFNELTKKSIPDNWRVEHEKNQPHFLTFDFAVCRNETGELTPKLIELQGFPSLYAFQSELASQYQNHFAITRNLSPYFNYLQPESYLDLLRRTILGNSKPEEVILLDINAPEQKTAVDFYLTARYLGIAVVALHELFQRDNQFFYTRNGIDYPVKKIYNRLIFDEIVDKSEAFRNIPDLLHSDQVEWVTHPNWFYRISKYTMPFLKGEFVPKTYFLSELKAIPENLADYVLKPLFSFAGQGVIIDVSRADITGIKDPENWILQEKVAYEEVIKTPAANVKCEIRLMYLWPDGEAEPTLAISLARLSRGKMIGVRYNKDYDWVGGTVCLF